MSGEGKRARAVVYVFKKNLIFSKIKFCLKRRTTCMNLYVLYKGCFLESFWTVCVKGCEWYFVFHTCSPLPYEDDETKPDWRRGKVFDDQFEVDK